MKFIVSTSFLLAFTFAGFGQEQIPDTFFRNLKGKPKSAILERIYVIIKGRNVGSIVKRLGSAHYDHDGKVVQSSLYGNGEERRIYARSGAEFRFIVTNEKGKSYTHTINYVEHKFDRHGNMTHATATAFNSNYPGRLIYQYVDQSTITYYEN